MATNYTNLLGFALPTTGELSGTWGQTVNDSITELVEDSIAGTATASVTSGDWTLSTTGSGAVNEARCAILRPTGSPGVTRNIIAPSSSKAYIVENQSNGAVVIKGAATVGATVVAGTTALVAWTGSDFVLVAQDLANAEGTLTTSKGGTGITGFTAANNALYSTSSSALTAGTLPVAAGGTGATTLTGVVKGNGTSAFTASTVSLTTEVTGTLPVANGGTGQTSYTDGQLLIGNTATGGLSKATITAGSGISVTNGNGSITIAASGGTGVASLSFGTTGLTSNTATTGAITVAGTLVVANGGTGATDAGTARTNLGATTVGGSFFTLTNPSAITFPRINANNTVSALDAATFRSAIGAGTGNGTVTSVTVSAGSGLSGGGTVTSTGTITLNNAGVTSLAGGTGISVNASTGGVTVTNTGVTSLTAGTGISLSGSTGGVTITNTAAVPVTYGAIGTYVAAAHSSWFGVNSFFNADTNYTGADLYGNSAATAAGTASLNAVSSQAVRVDSSGGRVLLGLSGTWKLMTTVLGSTNGTLGPIGLLLRIS